MIPQRFTVSLRTLSAPNTTLQVLPEDYEGTGDSSVTIQQDTDTGLSFSYGNSITFYNAARQLILDELITSPNAPLNGVEILIFDTCCKNPDGSNYLIFQGIIRRSDVELTIRPTDQACAVECSFSDYSQTSDALKCLKESVVFSRQYGQNTSDGENEGRDAVYMTYYEETRPRTFASFVYFLGFYLATTITIIINIFTFGLINLPSGRGFLRNIRADIANSFVRKKFHKTPFLASYVRNACKLCGLQLQSSLFAPGGFFENVVRLDAGINEGGKDKADADAIYADFNSPNITFVEFFQSLRALNVRFWIENGNTLVVERRDYQASQWIDFVQRIDDVETLNLQFGDEFPPAVRVYEYSNDLTDKTGQEALRLISGFAVNYSNPPNPALRGSDKVVFPFGTWRVIGDRLESPLNDLRTSPVFNTLYRVQDGYLIMESGVCAFPKLFEYDTASPQLDARMKDLNRRFYIENRRSGRSINTLYPQLLFIDDPRTNNVPTQDFELVFIYTCDDLRSFGFNKTVLIPYLNGTTKTGTVETLTINFKDGTATVKGKV